MEKVFQTGLAFFLGLTIFTGCTSVTEKRSKERELGKMYGEKVSEAGALSVNELTAMLRGRDSAQAKIAATAVEICHVKGCWMNVEVPGKDPMRVSFKGYSFFLPKEVIGKEVVFEGVALRDTISVEDQRHFAEDAGKTQKEIAAITQPKVGVTFVAKGVLVKK